MAGRFATLIDDAIKESLEDFNKQFMSSRECQDQAFWLRTLGQLLQEVRSETAKFNLKEISTDGVGSVIIKVAVMAALSDFCLERFGEELSSGGD